jgi:hypothetical protein
MTGETVSMSEAVSAKSDDEGQTRQRSTIQFPYEDLQSAIDLASAIHSNAGLGECDDSQLAVWSGQSPKSSGYRIQLAAARLFGFVETTAGQHKLTQLGSAVIDPNSARAAKVEAFLTVPLFKAIYEKYKGGVLPSQAAALEREIVAMGVSDKVKDRARVKFEKSADSAGFFEHGKNRLVMPAVSLLREGPPAPEKEKEEKLGGGLGGGGNGGGRGSDLNLDPLLVELLKKIPPTESGWDSAQRLRWFRTFAMNVSQIYDTDDPVELEIKISKEN